MRVDPPVARQWLTALLGPDAPEARVDSALAGLLDVEAVVNASRAHQRHDLLLDTTQAWSVDRLRWALYMATLALATGTPV